METAESRRVYALWIQRVGCWLVDAAIPAALITFGYLIGQPSYRQVTETINGTSFEITVSNGFPPAFYLILALAVLFMVWNKGYREGTSGQSIGKQFLGFTTVNASTGEPLGFARATARAVLLVADFAICYVGVLWPLWDGRRQCLISDKATKSVVLSTR